MRSPRAPCLPVCGKSGDTAFAKAEHLHLKFLSLDRNVDICNLKTAVVILNWNGKALLETFLPTVVKSCEGLATVVLADNASTDESVTYCRSRFPEVKIVQNQTNGGYAKGYNEALAAIDAELYVLLNNDVATPEGWLKPMIALFKQDSNLGAAQPKILDYHNKTYFEYAGASGGFLDGLGYPYCRGRIFTICEEDKDQYNDTVAVDWASGAALFVRKSVFNEVGGFDIDYFAHQEEIDLCWRIRDLGYTIKSCGASFVYHKGGGTLESASPKKTFYNFRNSLFTILKNEIPSRLLLVILSRLLLDGIAGLRFLFLGKFNHLAAIIKAHFSFYRYSPKMLSKRKKHINRHSYTVNSIVYKHFIKGINHYLDL